VYGAADLDAAAGATVIVIADRHGGAGEWNGDAGLRMIDRVSAMSRTAPLVLAGPGQRDLMHRAFEQLHVPAARLIGSAPDALASAARALVAAATNRSPQDVNVPLVGAPPHWVLVWSTARVGGSEAVSALSGYELARIEAQIRASWPPGAYTLGSAAARVVRAILTGALREATIFTPVERPSDIRRAVVAVPALVDASGVGTILYPVLSAREQVLLGNALPW
jgi:malate/lactate dehydrogenase